MINIKIIERKANESKAIELSKKYGISKDIVSFLLGRNVPENIIPLLVSKEELELLPNNSLTNVKEAAELISKYLEDDSNIYIYGDYDSDGVNATYIMYMALIELAEGLEVKTNIVYHLPNRREGYGLSMEWCERLEDNNNTLVITVDNGISKVEEVEYLKSRGIEVIITDHHKPQAEVPDCLIVDAHLNDTDNVNACGLCGAAVAYKVIAYLYEMYQLDYEYVKKYVSHVGVATITDVMPFTEENVIFVNNTLKYINDYPYENEEYIPITEPMHYYAEYTKNERTTAKDIAFGLGPQINSCGRMGNIQAAMDFMLSTHSDDLVESFKNMVGYNEIRKAATKEALSKIEPPKPTDLSLIVKIIDAEGIAGSIASNLCELYDMPVIVFNSNDGILSGSARCPEWFDIQWLLNKTDHIISYGGHASAAGLSIKEDNYDKFVESFNKAVSKAPAPIIQTNEVYVDKVITSSDLNRYTINQYNNVLFFNDFTRPVYALKDIQILGYHTSANNPNNICFHVKVNNRTVKLWSWGYTETYKMLGEPKLLNMIGTLEIFKGMFVINIMDIEAA